MAEVHTSVSVGGRVSHVIHNPDNGQGSNSAKDGAQGVKPAAEKPITVGGTAVGLIRNPA